MESIKNQSHCIENYSLQDWFVVKTLSRHEKKVAKQLEELNYNVYLPLLKTIKIWSDRKKKVEVPLISSVLFVQNTEVNKEIIYSIPGFHSILRLNGKIGKVRTSEIEQLKIITGEMEVLQEVEDVRLFPGDEIEIIGGPLRGYFAKAIEELNAYKVLIQIEALGCGYSVNIPKNQVCKIK